LDRQPGRVNGYMFTLELTRIVALSLFVSGLAVIIGGAAGIPLGTWLGLSRFRGARWLVRVSYTMMGLPPVLAGLVIYLLLSASGPLGGLELLFTPTAMIIAQVLLVTPIVAGVVLAGVRDREGEVREAALALGATRPQAALAVLRESRRTVCAALLAGFGRAIAEVGAVMLVGGNIAGHTRVMTTAIVLETRKGNFALAVALGLVLLAVSFAVNSLVQAVEEAGYR